MLGKVWGLFCCNKRKHPDQTSARESNCKVAHICSAETVGAVSQVNDGDDGGSEAQPRGKQKADAAGQALECQVNPDTENMDMSLNEFTLDDLISSNDQSKGENSVMRGYIFAKQRIELVQEEGQEAGVGHFTDTDQDIKLEKYSQHHKCPGMNEVLEMMRDGVSLRHVIKVHKLDAESELNGQMEPELHRILKKRKESSDHYISDGSVISNPMASYMVTVPKNSQALKNCPGQNYLHHGDGNEQQ